MQHMHAIPPRCTQGSAQPACLRLAAAVAYQRAYPQCHVPPAQPLRAHQHSSAPATARPVNLLKAINYAACLRLCLAIHVIDGWNIRRLSAQLGGDAERGVACT
jgi:hypothetical protein